mgnify:CR=1 FL=1
MVSKELIVLFSIFLLLFSWIYDGGVRLDNLNEIGPRRHKLNEIDVWGKYFGFDSIRSALIFLLIIYEVGVIETWPSQGFWAFVWGFLGVVMVVIFFYGFGMVSEKASMAFSPVTIQQQGLDLLTGPSYEIYGSLEKWKEVKK